MTINYTPKDAVIDVIAIALIVAPEPLTTGIGISLLLRKRGSSAEHEPGRPHHNYPDYVYKVDTIHGREITWEVRTIQPGQLPLKELNKPEVKIKPREQYILSRTAPAKSASQRLAENLPPGVRVHHEIFRPSPIPISGRQVFIPGETIHHAIRQLPQLNTMSNRAQPGATIHHTIENSPGYYRAQAGGNNVSSSPKIIHHTIKDSPGVQQGNPANIVRPVRIIEHHSLNATPPVRVNGRLFQPSTAPSYKGGILGKYGNDAYRR
ncbi:MAG: hypothetical protein WB588_07470 [Dehalococcoidia bacterium]